MKPKTLLLLLLLLSPLFIYTTCKKTPAAPRDYIVLGWGGGFTGMYTYYIVQNGQLRKDTVHRKPYDPQDVNGYQFDVVMPDSLYKKVADLKSYIPQDMLDHNNADYGTANVADGGGHIVRTVIGNVNYRWTFEFDQTKSSPEVREFYKRLQVLPY